MVAGADGFTNEHAEGELNWSLSLRDCRDSDLTPAIESFLRRFPAVVHSIPPQSKYQTERLLGKGSFGTVYRVRDLVTNDKHAMKAIQLPGYQRSRETCAAWKSILAEIEVLKDLNHPNCISLRDVMADETCIYIITDFAGRQSLELFAHTNPISERDASEIAYHVLRALQYLHEVKHIVHRDIKPENIIISRKAQPEPSEEPQQCPKCNQCCQQWLKIKEQKVYSVISRGGRLHERGCDKFDVKLVDFGSSRFVSKEGMDEGLHATPVGTSLYLSFESIELALMSEGELSGVHPDLAQLPKADVFSLGVVIFILLCRMHPFRGTTRDSLPEMRRKMRNLSNEHGIDFPDEAVLSDVAKDFLQRVLSLDPTRRSSAAEALRHLWILQRKEHSSHPSEKPIKKCACPKHLIYSAPETRGRCWDEDSQDSSSVSSVSSDSKADQEEATAPASPPRKRVCHEGGAFDGPEQRPSSHAPLLSPPSRA